VGDTQPHRPRTVDFNGHFLRGSLQLTVPDPQVPDLSFMAGKQDTVQAYSFVEIATPRPYIDIDLLPVLPVTRRSWRPTAMRKAMSRQLRRLRAQAGAVISSARAERSRTASD